MLAEQAERALEEHQKQLDQQDGDLRTSETHIADLEDKVCRFSQKFGVQIMVAETNSFQLHCYLLWYYIYVRVFMICISQPQVFHIQS